MNKCRARLELGDDMGDNECTFHCQLERGHPGLHIESFSHYGYKYKDGETGELREERSKHVCVSWWGNEGHQFDMRGDFWLRILGLPSFFELIDKVGSEKP